MIAIGVDFHHKSSCSERTDQYAHKVLDGADMLERRFFTS